MDTNTQFDDFIKQLRPNQQEKEFVAQWLREIEKIIHSEPALADTEFVQCGALKRESMLKTHLQAGLLCLRNRRSIAFREFSGKTAKALREASLSFSRVANRFDVLAQHPENQSVKATISVYTAYKVNSPRQMKEVRHYEFYRGNAVKFHTQYTNKQRPRFGKYINLILLLKHWKHNSDVPIDDFLLEILASHSLERMGEKSWENCIIAAFTDILAMLNGKAIFPVNWEKKYDNTEISAKPAGGKELLVADPANPAYNLAYSIGADDFPKIYEAAEQALQLAQSQDWNVLFDTDMFFG